MPGSIHHGGGDAVVSGWTPSPASHHAGTARVTASYPTQRCGGYPALGHRAGRREESSQGLVIHLYQVVLFGNSTCCFSLWKCPWTRHVWQVPAAPQAPVFCHWDRG